MPHAGIQEGQFAVTVFELFEVVFGDVLEGVMARLESDAGALFQAIVIAIAGNRRGIAGHDQRIDRIAVFEPHPMRLALAPDHQFRAIRTRR